MQSSGKTSSERFLTALCRDSFLNLWSYSNLYNDRGIERLSHGQELCDVLIVFGDDVLIFSDKSCLFRADVDLETGWSRWFRSAIWDSAKQLYGAERWIRNHPNRIWLDSGCTKPFPIPLPKPQKMRVHRIAVALGAENACAKHAGSGSSGSLMLGNFIEGRQHFEKGADPFLLGHTDKSRGFVHAFDSVSLAKVMRELDTIDDFVRYLRAKESLLLQDKAIIIPGEEDFLGLYLRQTGSVDAQAFLDEFELPGAKVIVFPEGTWGEYDRGPIAQYRRSLVRGSRIFDSMIAQCAQSISRRNEDGSVPLEDERIVRFLAAEPRHQRALFSGLMQKKIDSTPPDGRSAIAFSSNNRELLYVFLLFPREKGKSNDEYKAERLGALDCYCMVAKHETKEPRFFIGIACEPGDLEFRSSDIVFNDYANWTEEMTREARVLQRECGIFDKYRSLNPVDEFRSHWPESLNRRARRAQDSARRKRTRKK